MFELITFLLDLLGHAVAQGGFVSDPHVYHFHRKSAAKIAKAIMWQTSAKMPFPVSCCKIIVFGGWSFAMRHLKAAFRFYGLILRSIGGKHCQKKMVRPNINTLWLFNIAMENSPFIDDFPMKNLHLQGIFHGYVK